MKYFLFVLSLYITLASSVSSDTRVMFPLNKDKKDTRSQYYVELLKLILEETKDVYGNYTLTGVRLDTVQSRNILEVKKNNLDILWTMTSKEREEDLYPIRIPLLKGFLGYRIFIIKLNNQDTFDEVDTLEDLKKLKAGQGSSWPDTFILKANDIPVATAPRYESLFSMLYAGRFDYFPRGINEPWEEIKRFGTKKFTIEKRFLFQYFSPIYFFVSKENTTLHERIETGLNQLIDNGKFNEFFYNYPDIKSIFELGNISERKIFHLDNPCLTEETKKILDEKKYWYTQNEEKKYIKQD